LTSFPIRPSMGGRWIRLTRAIVSLYSFAHGEWARSMLAGVLPTTFARNRFAARSAADAYLLYELWIGTPPPNSRTGIFVSECVSSTQPRMSCRKRPANGRKRSGGLSGERFLHTYPLEKQFCDSAIRMNRERFENQCPIRWEEPDAINLRSVPGNGWTILLTGSPGTSGGWNPPFAAHRTRPAR